MTTGFTTNYKFPIISTGDDVNTWGQALNLGTFTPLDAILGSFIPVTMAAGANTISAVQFQNLGFALGSAPGADSTFVIPLSANPATPTVACGGMFIVVNDTTGAGNVTVLTAASGSVGVVVPQGFAVVLYSDGTDVQYANSGLPGFAQASNGNPNGILGGTAASANTNASLAFDYANGTLYVCVTSGVAGVAVWANPLLTGSALPVPQGYLTLVNSVPIITSDAISQGVVWYAPYLGSWTLVHNGTQIIPFRFTQQSLVLTTTQAANQIYDIYMAYNTGTPVIGSGPTWAAGTGGSVTPGSCARGTGSGGAAIQRDSVSGVWVNAATMTLTANIGSGNVPITVSAGQGIYLGSISIDGTAGQVSCYRSFGQGRKFGVWNAYNRTPIKLIGGSNVSSWTYNGGARQSDGDSGNVIQTFTGLAEEEISFDFSQRVTMSNTIAGINFVGLNSTTSGFQFQGFISQSPGGVIRACGVVPPGLGINNLIMGELTQGSGNVTFFGTVQQMLMTTEYDG